MTGHASRAESFHAVNILRDQIAMLTLLTWSAHLDGNDGSSSNNNNSGEACDIRRYTVAAQKLINRPTSVANGRPHLTLASTPQQMLQQQQQRNESRAVRRQQAYRCHRRRRRCRNQRPSVARACAHASPPDGSLRIRCSSSGLRPKPARRPLDAVDCSWCGMVVGGHASPAATAFESVSCRAVAEPIAAEADSWGQWAPRGRSLFRQRAY